VCCTSGLLSVIKIDHNINKMEVWRPWDCECNQNNVEEADLVVDNDGDGKNQDKIVTVLLYNVHILFKENPGPVKKARQHLPLEAKIVARNVYNFFLKQGATAPLKTTSEATQIPLSTLSRIVNSNEEDLPRAPTSRKSIKDVYSENEIKEMKRIIYRMFDNNKVPTLEGIKSTLNEQGFPFSYSVSSLRKLLHHIGFTYKIIDKRLAIMESERLKVWRTKFIQNIRQYRQEGRLIVYLDETWYDTHDVLKKGWVDDSGKCRLITPPSRGKRLIILHACSEHGWVPNSLLISAKNIANCNADYHSDMNHQVFEEWFKNRLLPNLPENSVIVIVMDNASYHSRQDRKLPTKCSKKQEIKDFMLEHKLEIPDRVTKSVLLQTIQNSDIDKTKSYAVDNMAKSLDHTIERLPPYYCVLNPIELVWSQLKHRVRKENKTPTSHSSVVDLVRNVVSGMNSDLFVNCVRHVKSVEDGFVSNSDFPTFIININDGSDDESDDELFI
jgi:transposase